MSKEIRFNIDGQVVDCPQKFVIGADQNTTTAFAITKTEPYFDEFTQKTVMLKKLYQVKAKGSLAEQSLKFKKGETVCLEVTPMPKPIEMNGIKYSGCNFELRNFVDESNYIGVK